MFNYRPEYKKKPVRSYVIRTGRITAGQKNAFDLYWPQYGLSLHSGEQDWAKVFSREAPTALEIGFGMGDSLLEMAKADPNTNFVGIEVHTPGVGRLISEAGQADLSNLKVYLADATDVLADCIPSASLQRIQIYFPDPWHKKKHHKRRLIQPAFVALLREKLRPGGVLHLATDWENYAEQMMEVMCSASGFTNLADEYHFAHRPDYRPRTKFELRGERLGHGVWDILFTRQS